MYIGYTHTHTTWRGRPPIFGGVCNYCCALKEPSKVKRVSSSSDFASVMADTHAEVDVRCECSQTIIMNEGLANGQTHTYRQTDGRTDRRKECM